jgi:hypothetical protein
MTHSCARTQVGRARRETHQAPVVAPPAPSHEEIARLAYTYWESRGRQHGSPEDDWYRAESELQRRRIVQRVGLTLSPAN